MSAELYVLTEQEELAPDGVGSVTIGVGEADEAQRQIADSPPAKLVFRALFQEPADATTWETRVRERLEKSGVRFGNEFYFVSESMVESLCDAAAHAETHEWLIYPASDEYVELATRLGRARLKAAQAFERWSHCGRTSVAEIRINSYEQHIARNDRRIQELRASYVTPRFFNEGEKRNTQLNYAVFRLREEIRKWRSDIRRLRDAIAENDVAFEEWLSAQRHVEELEQELAAMSPE
ncbi:MAG: hypothetical protein QNJ73_04850 [Gammaproteobacteria bacterium]|nr:hypothetical protein [Gammaproteobacteria bacterium]